MSELTQAQIDRGECHHGMLRRSCEICLLNDELHEAKCIITDLTAHLHDAIAILGWSKPDWQRTIERAKGEV